MAKKSLDKVMRHIRMVAAVHAYRGLPDRELLERFTKLDDEAAFTVIIDRHGPMILGVCRRALGSLHDAEDVCQATFLVLARKAASIRKTTSLSSWLHGVACRGAACFARARTRRQRRERTTAAPAPVKDAAGEVSWREIQSILDQELEQLPQRYRGALILCYLGGKTRDEAAGQLGLTSATLHGRLERGRNLLRERLTRRGLSLSAALFATALGDSALRAALPASFVITSAKAALALAAGQTVADGVISASVLTLTREVLKTMLVAKLKLGTAAVICASLIATVTCGTWTSTGVAQDMKPEAAKVTSTPGANAESDEDFIRRLSRDLRGSEPTPTEIHFFVANKDAGKRQKLIDLLIQERQAKKAVQAIEAGASVNTHFEGALLPIKRAQIYAPAEGLIVGIREGLKSGSPVVKDEELLRIGEFAVKSPMRGIVLSTDFRERLQNKHVKAGEPLLRIGSADGNNPKLSDWEIELKIPPKHIGQVLEAFANKGPNEETDVDFILSSAPTKSFRGKLLKSKIARDANNKADLLMLAWVRISGPDIPEEYRLTVELLLTGVEVRAPNTFTLGQETS